MNQRMKNNIPENRQWPVRFEDSARLLSTKDHKHKNKVKIKNFQHDNWLDNLLHPMGFIVSQIHKWFI